MNPEAKAEPVSTAGRAGRSRWRRIRAPIRLAAAHVRHRWAPVLLVSLGVAAATALLVGVRGDATVTQERTISYALTGLPADQRVIRVTWGGLGAATPYSHIDEKARRALAGLVPGETVRALLLRQSTFDGRLVQLAAIADLARVARIKSGRLPRGPCRPARCEVVQVGTPGPAVVSAAGLRFVTVGHGELTSPVPLGSASPPPAAGPTAEAHYPASHAPPPYLISGDVRGFASLPALQLIYRTYEWSTPIQPDAVHAWDITRLLSREATTSTTLETAGYEYALTSPDQTLLNAQHAGRVAQRRMLLIGGGATAFLLLFILVSGGAFRRSLAAEWDRLLERGAHAWQVWLFAMIECASAAALGVAGGVATGLAATAWAAHAAGRDAGTLLGHSLVSDSGVMLALLVWAIASITLLAAARLPVTTEWRARLGVLDVIGLGAVGALVLAAARGQVDTASLGGTNVDPLIPLLPVLLAVVVVAAAARLLPIGARLAERATRRRSVTLRLALVSLARRPEAVVVTVALVAVSLGFGLFAATYRATLIHAQHDQADYQVPLDYTLTEGPALVLPLQAAPLSRYRALAGAIDAYPVLRRSATAAIQGTQPVPITLLGVPPAAIPELRGWSADGSPVARGALATRLAAGGGEARLRGAAIPTDARTLVVTAAARGDPVQLGVAIAERNGGFTTLRLGTLGGRRTLRAAVPPEARGGLAVGLQVAPTYVAQETLESVGGTLTLGPLRAHTGTTVGSVTTWRGWIGQGGLRPAAGRGALVIRYAISGQANALLRPHQATDGRSIPMLASSDIAAGVGRGGTIVLSLGNQQVPGRIVATAHLFPTTQDTPSEFVVVDERQLALTLNSAAPGTGLPDELWLGLHAPSQAAPVRSALRQPPFNTLQVASRSVIDARLRDDPLSQTILVILVVASVLALAFALLGLVLTVAAALGDERAELFDLEAQGIDPGALRRCLRLRAALVTAAGMLGGIVVGGILAGVVIDLVRLTANATSPQPPLSETFDLRFSVLGAVAFAALAAILLGGVTRGWFRRSSLLPSGEVEP